MATARTVIELIKSSLRAIGSFGVDQVLAAEELEQAFEVLQDLMSGFSPGMIPGTTTEAITLVATQASYTVGESGSPDLSTVRPEHIFHAFIRDSSNYDHPVEVISETQYNQICSKTTAGRPEHIWYNPTAPNGTIYAYPTPSAIESLYIVSKKPFTESTATTQELLNDLGIPRNYHNPLKWILARELASEYGIEPSNNVLIQAEKGENKIESLNVSRNTHPVDLGLPQTARSSGNIFNG